MKTTSYFPYSPGFIEDLLNSPESIDRFCGQILNAGYQIQDEHLKHFNYDYVDAAIEVDFYSTLFYENVIRVLSIHDWYKKLNQPRVPDKVFAVAVNHYFTVDYPICIAKTLQEAIEFAMELVTTTRAPITKVSVSADNNEVLFYMKDKIALEIKHIEPAKKRVKPCNHLNKVSVYSADEDYTRQFSKSIGKIIKPLKSSQGDDRFKYYSKPLIENTNSIVAVLKKLLNEATDENVKTSVIQNALAQYLGEETWNHLKAKEKNANPRDFYLVGVINSDYGHFLEYEVFESVREGFLLYVDSPKLDNANTLNSRKSNLFGFSLSTKIKDSNCQFVLHRAPPAHIFNKKLYRKEALRILSSNSLERALSDYCMTDKPNSEKAVEFIKRLGSDPNTCEFIGEYLFSIQPSKEGKYIRGTLVENTEDIAPFFMDVNKAMIISDSGKYYLTEVLSNSPDDLLHGFNEALAKCLNGYITKHITRPMNHIARSITADSILIPMPD